MKYGDKYYRILSDLSFQELTFKNMEGKSCMFHDQHNTQVKLSGRTVAALCRSSIVILAELKERLELKLKEVHRAMERHKIDFNPSSDE